MVKGRQRAIPDYFARLLTNEEFDALLEPFVWCEACKQTESKPKGYVEMGRTR